MGCEQKKLTSHYPPPLAYVHCPVFTHLLCKNYIVNSKYVVGIIAFVLIIMAFISKN